LISFTALTTVLVIPSFVNFISLCCLYNKHLNKLLNL
jgi:hypothetical protein